MNSRCFLQLGLVEPLQRTLMALALEAGHHDAAHEKTLRGEE